MARIALVLPNLKCGGAERVALTLARHFVGSGHEVDLVLMERTGEFLECVPEGVRMVDLGVRGWGSAIWPLTRYLKNRSPDAVHASMWPLTAVAAIAHRLSGSKSRLVTLDHATLSNQYPRRARPVRWSIRLLYPRASARAVVSAEVANDLAALARVPTQFFSIVPSPIDLPPQLSSSTAAEKIWPTEGMRILNVARLDPMKDHELLLRAFALLPAELDAGLLIIGDGPLRPRLETLARELDIADRVVFRGSVADPWPYYASADAFALSSSEESFGIVLVEALHAALPIVSTSTDGAKHVLAGGRFGRLVEKNDPEALAAGLRDALASPVDKDALRARAAELASAASLDEHLRLLVPDAA